MAISEVVVDSNDSQPVLIIDRFGMFGLVLCEKLSKFTQVVLISSKEPYTNSEGKAKNIVYFPFKNVLSNIPEEKYSHTFFIPESDEDIKDFLTILSEKSKENKTRLVLVLDKALAATGLLDYIKAVSKDAAIIILGDMFGQPLGFEKTFFTTLFYALKKHKTITVYDMGLRELYPVFFDDAVLQIIKISFSQRLLRGVFLIFPRYPTTELSVVRSIQKIDPLVTLDFSKGKSKDREKEVVIDGEYVLGENYDVLKKIQEAYGVDLQITPLQEKFEVTKIDGKKMELKQESPKKDDKFWANGQWKKKTNGKILPRIFLSFIIFLAFFLLGVPIIALFLGAYDISLAKSDIEHGNLIEAKKTLISAGSLFSFSNNFFDTIHFSVLKQKISSAQGITQVLQDLVSSAQDIEAGKSDGEHTVEVLRNSILSIKNLDSSILPKSIADILISQQKLLSLVADTADAFPKFLGFNGKKTYLVLFQNNAELRPGGGFIGSYGLLTIEKAKVLDFSIYDVYDADGQLKGHIEPPFQIRRYIPREHLYLRDSNFDFDYTKNALTAAMLFKQEMNVAVDGVISVDLSFAREIIGVVGGVYVPSYNEQVTKDNFYALAENHAEKDFFPGSTQKKDFLRSVFTALQEKIIKQKTLDSQKLLSALSFGFFGKHILIATSDQSLQDIFTSNGLSSSIWDPRGDGQDNELNDFLGINEANLGVNKVNYFIHRKVQDDLTIDRSGSVSATLTVVFNNTSNGTWPGGEYKNYFRAMFPKDTTITQISIDDVPQKTVPAVTDFLVYEKPSFVAPKGLELEKSQENNKDIIGFLFTVPSGETKKITISYFLKKRLNLLDPLLQYNLFYFKQPGTEDYPFIFSLTFPQEFTYIKGDNNIKQIGNGILFKNTVTSDIHSSFEIGRQK